MRIFIPINATKNFFQLAHSLCAYRICRFFEFFNNLVNSHVLALEPVGESFRALTLFCVMKKLLTTTQLEKYLREQKRKKMLYMVAYMPHVDKIYLLFYLDHVYQTVYQEPVSKSEYKGNYSACVSHRISFGNEFSRKIFVVEFPQMKLFFWLTSLCLLIVPMAYLRDFG
uniref:Uncharacterized protein n=1 Tax=Rhizophagus irregularis (strain DAOM 181602 / DAOM 197198 / MUCL 43194) TaxID=747089 RepID=U9UJ45_RHIID